MTVEESNLGVTDVLEDFSMRCSWLLTAYEGDADLERSLMGLYYSAKSTLLAPRIIQFLLSGDPDESVKSGRGDDVCWVAESLVRSIHSSGDLLAQVVNISLCQKQIPAQQVGLKSVATKLHFMSDAEVDEREKKWLDTVANELDALRESDEFIYLTDFANTVKHRDYIDRVLVTNPDGCHLGFEAFTKDTRSHDARSFLIVLGYAEAVRDICHSLLLRMEQQANYAQMMNTDKKAIVQTFRSVTATPSVITPEQFSSFTHKRIGEDSE